MWEVEDEDELGYDADTGTPVVEIDTRYYGLMEVHQRAGRGGEGQRGAWLDAVHVARDVGRGDVPHGLEEAR